MPLTHDHARVGRCRIHRFEDFSDGEEITLGDQDRIILPVNDIERLVGDIEVEGWIEPAGHLTIYLDYIELFGDPSVSAMASCSGLPDEFCGVVATSTINDQTGELQIGFACRCDWPDGFPPPTKPKCRLQLGPGLLCISQGCTGVCRLRAGWTLGRRFALYCECS